MEQEQTPNLEQLSTQIGNEKHKEIGRNKYNFLKSIPIENRTEEQNNLIKEYEDKLNYTPEEQVLKVSDYFEKILNPSEKKEISITSRQLWNLFKFHFEKITGNKYQKTPETIQNLEPIIYYFAKDERFFNCVNISTLSKPSFDKGLLIIGDFGNGKTSVMKSFESIFQGVHGISFKGYTANEVVTMFEKITDDENEHTRTQFENAMYNGIRYFDDLKTERIASKYGKVNLFKEILEERYNRKLKTHITCNFKEGFYGNIEVGISEFGERYGGRVYDRMFEMYNIIEFKCKSFRK